jgi:alpha-tubulin suppressor-like RCC1 family protein
MCSSIVSLLSPHRHLRSCGESHTCGVRNEAVVVCWGSNIYNQSTVPTAIPYLDPETKTMKTAPFKFSSCFPGFTRQLSDIVRS